MPMWRVYSLQFGAVNLLKSSPTRDRAIHVGEFLVEQGWSTVVVECDDEGRPLDAAAWCAVLTDWWMQCARMLLVDGVSWAPLGQVPWEFPQLDFSPPASRKRARRAVVL